MSKKWFQETYRRHLLDHHIADWNDKFMSEFDHKTIADNLLLLNAKTATVFANTHVGLCNYPTKVGAVHKAFRERDALREMIDNCHDRGLNVVVYYCTIYTDWYWDTHPDCRIVDAEGNSEKLLMNSKGNPRRFSVCCPNNEGYREFVVKQLEEICTGYEFEGMWPDMTFWPTVCYCRSCRNRYAAEVGGEIPRVINWEDPVWVQFQRKRQAWLVDFVRMITDTVKKYKPGATVAHQSHTYTDDWLFAPSVELAKHTDWLSADLYRDKQDMSFLSKMFHSLSGTLPYEHLNCWNFPSIHEHVVPRSEESLRCTAFSALANNGAMVFIDAIDPVGTVNQKNYIRAGKVFKDLERFERHAGGRFCQDIGIYYSFDANFDLSENGCEVTGARYNFDPRRKKSRPEAHVHAAIGMAKAILQKHYPYGVVTKKDLGRLSDFQILVLPNTVMLDQEEVEAIKAFVRNGGGLYASKYTSLLSSTGHRQKDFQLTELVGVSYEGETEETVTYVAPVKDMPGLFGDYDKRYPVTVYGNQLKVTAHPGAEILATVTLPYTKPEGGLYSSILTDPPGISTEYPAIVLTKYGKGRVLYTAGALETWEHESQREILGNLLKLLATGPFHFEALAPAPVEITLFEQEEKKRYILNLVNFQRELPNIPVRGIGVRIRLDGRQPLKLVDIESGTELPYRCNAGFAEIEVPQLDTFRMLELSYGPGTDLQKNELEKEADE